MTPESLAELLQQLNVAQDENYRRKFDRSLPFADALFDRWERARRLGFKENTSIYNSALVFGEVNVGPNTWIGPYALLDGSGGTLTIGAYCSISAGVQLYTHDTVMWALSGGAEPKKTGQVSIGDRCYIGSQSIIGAGATIGRQCVVAANSYVNRSVPDQTIVGGSPAHDLGVVVVKGGNIRLDFASDPERQM